MKREQGTWHVDSNFIDIHSLDDTLSTISTTELIDIIYVEIPSLTMSPLRLLSTVFNRHYKSLTYAARLDCSCPQNSSTISPIWHGSTTYIVTIKRRRRRLRSTHWQAVHSNPLVEIFSSTTVLIPFRSTHTTWSIRAASIVAWELHL